MVLLGSAEVHKVIEGASPPGKDYGQKVDASTPPDLRAMSAEPRGTNGIAGDYSNWEGGAQLSGATAVGL